MTIYEIDDAIMNLIDEETGEITDLAALEALEMEREKKITYVACLLKNQKALKEAIHAERQELEKREKAADRTVESCKKYLLYALNETKFENDRCKISYRHTDKVVIDENKDIETMPLEFVRITKDFNKTAIKDAINAGQTIDGCQVINSTSVIVK